MNADKPSIELYNPNPSYLRRVISGINDRSLFYGDSVSVKAIARRIGVSERSMQKYLSESAKTKHEAPYVVQYALEQLSK